MIKMNQELVNPQVVIRRKRARNCLSINQRVYASATALDRKYIGEAFKLLNELLEMDNPLFFVLYGDLVDELMQFIENAMFFEVPELIRNVRRIKFQTIDDALQKLGETQFRRFFRLAPNVCKTVVLHLKIGWRTKRWENRGNVYFQTEYNGCVVHEELGLLMFMYYWGQGENHGGTAATLFGCDSTYVGRVANAYGKIVSIRFGPCVNIAGISRFGHVFLEYNRSVIETYIQKVKRNPHDDVIVRPQMIDTIGFLDGTGQTIYKPTDNERSYYSGYRKNHELRYLGIAFPDGIFLISRPMIGASNDINLVENVGIVEELTQPFNVKEQNGVDETIYYKLFGDHIFVNSPVVWRMPKEDECNRDFHPAIQGFELAGFRRCRSCIEHSFGDIKQTMMRLGQKGKLSHNNVVHAFFATSVILNIRNITYTGSTATTIFDLLPQLTVPEFLSNSSNEIIDGNPCN